MTEAKANREAAAKSKTGAAHYVVWVFDEGRAVFNAEQARIYGALVHIEAAYVAGVKVAHEVAA